jgi:valyl-tRNA synthetase
MLKWGKELKWHPEYMIHRYNNWVNGLQWDWLISNQRYFGVPFPVWYCKDCNTPILADEKQLPVEPLKDKPLIKSCPKCNSKEFIPETDVLNTWFTSSLTPQLAIWLMPKPIQKELFPMDLRPQAHEIITFWLFNTSVKSHLHFNKTPWKNTMISGFVTLKGEKMSKSKGNIIQPQEVMEKYGADAIRYWAASSKLGEDFDYQEKDVVTGKKFTTKILNAVNFAFLNIKQAPKEQPKLNETDSLFLLQLNNLINETTKAFENYNYSKAKMEINSFFWNELCDNYLEIVKNRVYNGTKEEKLSASYTLYQSLLAVIKLMAPIMPFITEELYQTHFKKIEKTSSIHKTEWPNQIKIKLIKNDNEKWNKLIEIIAAVRHAKSESKKSMKADIILILPAQDKKLLKDMLADLKAVTNAKEIKEGKLNVQFI